MELIKSIARRRDESLPRQDHSELPGFLTCSGIRVSAQRREVGRRGRDEGAEMFSVDCSLCRRKFALSFSLWSRALNPFLLQIQSPLLREVLPFIVNPRFFIARVETILHGQRKMIFENRASPRWVLTSGFHCGKLRRGTSYPKARTLRSLMWRMPKIKR